MIKKLSFILLVFIVSSGGVIASDINYLSAPQRINVFIQNMESDLIERQEQIKSNAEDTRAILKKNLSQHVDFKLLSRYVLGRNWNKASPAQQQEFIQSFTNLLIRFYAGGLESYLQSNRIVKGMIEVLPHRDKKEAKYTRVKTAMKVTPGAPPIKVNYSLYNTSVNGWMIYDISVEGISLVASYRSSFNDMIKKEKMQGLLKHLKEKTEAAE